MAKNINTVPFVNPYADNAIDNQLAYKKALRRQELAKSLLDQAMAQDNSGTEMVSGVAVKKSPLDGLVKALKGYAGYKLMDGAEKDIVSMDNENIKLISDSKTNLLNAQQQQPKPLNFNGQNAQQEPIQIPQNVQTEPVKIQPPKIQNDINKPLTFNKQPYTPITLNDLKNPDFYNNKKPQLDAEAIAIRELEIQNAKKNNDNLGADSLQKALEVYKSGKMSENKNNPQPFIVDDTKISVKNNNTKKSVKNNNMVNKPFMPELEQTTQQNIQSPQIQQTTQDKQQQTLPIENKQHQQQQQHQYTPQEVFEIEQAYPGLLQKIMEARMIPTNEMRNREALGITLEQAKTAELAKMANDANGKMNEKGIQVIRDANGEIISYKPIDGYGAIQGQNQYTESYAKTAAENAANLPYKQKISNIELAKENAIAAYKANLDNKNSIKEIQLPNGQFINTTNQKIIDNINSGKQSVAKLSVEDNVQRKNYEQHYASLAEKNKTSTKNIELAKDMLKLSDLQGIGAGADIRNKYQTYLKSIFPNIKIDSLTNQQLLQASAAKMGADIISQNGGLGRITDADLKYQVKTMVDPTATPEAIKNATYYVIANEQKNQQDYKHASTISKNGKDFSSYQQAYENKPFNKHLNVINAFHGDRQAQANYINNLLPADRAEAIKTLKNEVK
jgi:hypothetical protein